MASQVMQTASLSIAARYGTCTGDHGSGFIVMFCLRVFRRTSYLNWNGKNVRKQESSKQIMPLSWFVSLWTEKLHDFVSNHHRHWVISLVELFHVSFQWLLSWLLHKWREGYLVQTWAWKITCRHFEWMVQSSSVRKWRVTNNNCYF